MALSPHNGRRRHSRPGLGPGARRERLIQIALAVLLFGCFSMVVRVSQLAGPTQAGMDKSRLHVSQGSIRRVNDDQKQPDPTTVTSDSPLQDMADMENEYQDEPIDQNSPLDSEEPPLKAAALPAEPVDGEAPAEDGTATDLADGAANDQVDGAVNDPVDDGFTDTDKIPFPQATGEEPVDTADMRVDEEIADPNDSPADGDNALNTPVEEDVQPEEEPSTTAVTQEVSTTENPITTLPTTAPATEDEEPPKESKPKRRRKKRKGKKSRSKSNSKKKKKQDPETPAPSPTPKKTLSAEELLEQQQKCLEERDFGLVDALRSAKTEYCASSDDEANGLTSVTTFKVAGGLRATLFRGLSMDFDHVRIFHPIRSLAQDGGSHDPRFVFTPNIIQCTCPELTQYAAIQKRTEFDRKKNKTVVIANPLRIWDPFLASVPSRLDHPSTVCAGSRNNLRLIAGKRKTNGSAAVITISDPVILIARRDDHNPFFQISNALNTWIMMRALDWDPAQTQVIHLDAGYPSPIDALHQRLLSPNRPLISGRSLMEQRVEFTSQVLLAPFETDGPMMQHLNDDEPCFNSLLIQEFRQVSLQALNVIKSPNVYEEQPEDDQEGEAAATTEPPSTAPVVVTVITRRAYGGRMVQRRWRNEDEVLDALRAAYADRNIRLDSVDFVTLELNEQMRIMVESDVVIGMHGAGMVNVLWTRPEALVIEIFPFKRKRWGYRNLCQFLGCSWYDFRGGKDIRTGKEDNANDKVIPFEEFFAFFDPLLTQHLADHGRTLTPLSALPPTDPDELQQLLD